LVASVLNDRLVLTWPNGVGWQLEMQTNSAGMGLGTNWLKISGATSPYTNVVDLAAPAAFYRLFSP
jgi:hypothetical protein